MFKKIHIPAPEREGLSSVMLYFLIKIPGLFDTARLTLLSQRFLGKQTLIKVRGAFTCLSQLSVLLCISSPPD